MSSSALQEILNEIEELLATAGDLVPEVTDVVDITRDVVERYTYTPHGEATVLDINFVPVAGNTSTICNELLYTGRRRDPETGLQLNRNRFYDAPLGRWVNRDPIGYAGGLDLYGYVASRPIFYTDSIGLLFGYVPDGGWPFDRPRPSRKDCEVGKKKCGSVKVGIPVKNCGENASGTKLSVSAGLSLKLGDIGFQAGVSQSVSISIGPCMEGWLEVEVCCTCKGSWFWRPYWDCKVTKIVIKDGPATCDPPCCKQ